MDSMPVHASPRKGFVILKGREYRVQASAEQDAIMLHDVDKANSDLPHQNLLGGVIMVRQFKKDKTRKEKAGDRQIALYVFEPEDVDRMWKNRTGVDYPWDEARKLRRPYRMFSNEDISIWLEGRVS